MQARVFSTESRLIGSPLKIEAKPRLVDHLARAKPLKISHFRHRFASMAWMVLISLARLSLSANSIVSRYTSKVTSIYSSIYLSMPPMLPTMGVQLKLKKKTASCIYFDISISLLAKFHSRKFPLHFSGNSGFLLNSNGLRYCQMDNTAHTAINVEQIQTAENLPAINTLPSSHPKLYSRRFACVNFPVLPCHHLKR